MNLENPTIYIDKIVTIINTIINKKPIDNQKNQWVNQKTNWLKPIRFWPSITNQKPNRKTQPKPKPIRFHQPIMTPSYRYYGSYVEYRVRPGGL